MTTIKGLLDRLEAFNMQAEVENTIIQTSYEIIILNQQQLFNYGRDREGLRLLPYRSQIYAKEKNYQNPRPGFGVPDLFRTGAFYSGFNVTIRNHLYEVNSTDSKRDKIVKARGEQIFGLTKDNQKVYSTGVFIRQFQSNYNAKTGLVFS